MQHCTTFDLNTQNKKKKTLRHCNNIENSHASITLAINWAATVAAINRSARMQSALSQWFACDCERKMFMIYGFLLAFSVLAHTFSLYFIILLYLFFSFFNSFKFLHFASLRCFWFSISLLEWLGSGTTMLFVYSFLDKLAFEFRREHGNAQINFNCKSRTLQHFLRAGELCNTLVPQSRKRMLRMYFP